MKLRFVALLALIVMGVAIVAVAQRSAARPPNFVVIFADDLGYGDLACYGHLSFRTPHLDRMAREGVRFTDFYVPTPYCAPSRATLLTGRYPFRSGVVFNPSPDAGINGVHLPLSEITIAEALKPLGYATTAIGKWHLGHLPAYLPRKQGFDEYYGILYSNDMRPVQIVHNEQVVQFPVPQSELTRDYTERALRFIDDNRERPFFLYLPHAMPHKPLAASEEFYTWETPDDLYADVIHELDDSVGRILTKLEELGLDDNTLVIFTSDNGPWFGGSTGGLRGMKGLSWEGGIRVPMIARWPGKIPAGRVVEHVTATIDIFPTLLKLAGAALPSDRVIDGKDLFPLMTSDIAQNPHEAIFAMTSAELRIVRSGRWKLHGRSPGTATRYQEDASDWVDPRGPDGVTIIAPYEQTPPNQYPGVLSGIRAKDLMLFDMENDPAEQHDVAAQHPEVVERLKALFDKMDAEVPEINRPQRSSRGILHLKGGALRYDQELKPGS